MMRFVFALLATAWELILMLLGVSIAYWLTHNFEQAAVVALLILGVGFIFWKNYTRAKDMETPTKKDDDDEWPRDGHFA